MPTILSRLALLALLLTPGTFAQAAGIGVNLRVHGHNIPQAVATGRNLHVGGGAGSPGLSRSLSATRSLQLDAAGEKTAVKPPN